MNQDEPRELSLDEIDDLSMQTIDQITARLPVREYRTPKAEDGSSSHVMEFDHRARFEVIYDGSVRARASKYSLCFRTCGDVPSRGFQDGQHRHGAAEELESAAIGGNVLVVAGARAEEVAEFVVSSAEPGC